MKKISTKGISKGYRRLIILDPTERKILDALIKEQGQSGNSVIRQLLRQAGEVLECQVLWYKK